METKKILGIIFSLVFVCAFAFVLSWGIINFNKVQEGLSGTGIYTEQDLNEAYQDGYDTALTDKDEYDTLINGYRDNITTLQDTISQLNSQITILTKNNKDYISAITDLEEVKTQNEQTILNLKTEIESNESTISLLESDKLELQIQVTNLEEQIVERNNKITELVESITSLEEEKEDLVIALNTSEENRAELEIEIAGLKEKISILESEKTSLISQNNILSNQVVSLNIQIDNLEELNSQLESINSANVTTITSLNSQIQTLNTQISDLIFASQNSTSIITSLQSQVSNLQESISYYQQVISGLIGENQVAVTFEFDGATYNIQVINAGSTANVANPVSSEYVIFNFWTVNGVRIDLSTYTFTENTKVIADVTYRYKVTYLVGDEEFDTQIVTKDEFATLPSDPEKEGYEFDGWSLDGITVVNNITTSPVLAHTTYKAVFTKIHTVTFMVEDEIEDTQTIRNGGYAVSVNVEDTEYRKFNGWLLNGSLVNISSQKIVSDTIFRASFTYKYDVYFVVDGEEYNSQIVTSGSYATIPASPTKTGYTFKGWSLSESGDIVNINSQIITTNTTFYAVFEINNYVVTFKDGTSVVNTQNISYNNNIILPDAPLKEGYTFKGWAEYDNGPVVELEGYKVTDNVTFYAVYEINNYTVNFVVENENYDTQIVNYGNYATTPVAPTKQGYTFKGWSLSQNEEVVYIDSYLISENTTFYAVFELTEFNISFEVDGEIISSYKLLSGETITEPDMSIYNTNLRKFDSWRVNGRFIDLINYEITCDTIFVADFAELEVQFSFENYEILWSSSSGYRGMYLRDTNSGELVSYDLLEFNYDMRFEQASDTKYLIYDGQNNKYYGKIFEFDCDTQEVRTLLDYNSNQYMGWDIYYWSSYDCYCIDSVSFTSESQIRCYFPSTGEVKSLTEVRGY